MISTKNTVSKGLASLIGKETRLIWDFLTVIIRSKLVIISRATYSSKRYSEENCKPSYTHVGKVLVTTLVPSCICGCFLTSAHILCEPQIPENTSVVMRTFQMPVYYDQYQFFPSH